MRKTSKNPLIFAVVLAFLAFARPGVAHAQSPTDPCASGQVNSAIDTANANAGQLQIQAANAAIGLFGAIDIKAQYCWSTIEAMFNSIGVLSDPLNLIWNLIITGVMKVIDQLCATVISDLNQLKTFALSQLNRLCLPLPQFGFGIGNLGLTPATCNGVSLVTVGTAPGMGLTPYNYRQFFPAQ